jgi:uncharacterized membrane protein YfcA
VWHGALRRHAADAGGQRAAAPPPHDTWARRESGYPRRVACRCSAPVAGGTPGPSSTTSISLPLAGSAPWSAVRPPIAIAFVFSLVHGAFVLTPAMMSMGVPGIVAVASNMCHKFPKALVGAIKRARYGQVDVKLGLFMGASAEAGVLYGAHLQQSIKAAFGEAGSNLYVSAAFVPVLAIVGGFVGVPSMMYVLGAPSMMASATELVIAFVMGLGGTIKFAWDGFVDIRLAMIILAGSLFGVQLGAIGTTYVKPFMIKIVMATIMLTVLFSRAFVIPVYLSELELIDRLVGELGLRDAEVLATAGMPSRDIRDAARLWQADIVLCACSAGTGLRSAGRRAKGGFAVVGLDDDGRALRRSAIARLSGG